MRSVLELVTKQNRYENNMDKLIERRFLVDFITEHYRSNDIIYAKDLFDCLIKFNELYDYRIIRIQDLEFDNVWTT